MKRARQKSYRCFCLLVSCFLFLLFSATSGQTNPLNLTAGQWTPISNNTMRSVSDCKDGCSWAGYGFHNIIEVWNGGAYGSNYHALGGTMGTYFIWGGGHNGYHGREIMGFDISKGLWKQLTDPQQGPTDHHSYDALEYDPAQHRFHVFISKDNGTTSYYDFDTETWDLSGATINNSQPYISSAFHPVRKMFYIVPGTHEYLVSMDPSNDAVQLMPNGFTAQSTSQHVMACDYDRDLLVFLNWAANITRVYNLKTNTSFQPTLSGELPPIDDCGGWEYVPAKGKFAFWRNADKENLYWLTVPSGDIENDNWVFEKETMGGSNQFRIDVDNGDWSRFRWVPAINAFIMVTQVDDAVYAYRPKGTLPPASVEAKPASAKTVAAGPGLSIFPQPATPGTRLNLSMSSTLPVQIFNAAGRLVASGNNLSAPKLPGVYFVRLQAKGKTFSRKLAVFN
jgi:hypothetical protein